MKYPPEKLLHSTIPLDAALGVFGRPLARQEKRARKLKSAAGGELLVGLPLSLAVKSPELARALRVLEQLREAGAIRRVFTRQSPCDEPFVYNFQTILADGEHCYGTDYLSEERALWKTLGESAERSLWFSSSEFYESRVLHKPYGAVKQQAIRLETLAGFTDALRAQDAKLSFTDESMFGWVKERSLTSGRAVLCPVQLLSARYFRTYQKEPTLRLPVTTGLATWWDFDTATLSVS